MQIAVIGLGIAGAMTAWRLAGMGHDVVGYDPYPAGHTLGSSHGESRVVRRVYPDPFYTRLMSESYALWREFFVETDTPSLLNLCGGLFLGPRDHPNVIAAHTSLREAGAPHNVMDADECRRSYPTLYFSNNEIGLFDPEMGYARASACVEAARAAAVARGAREERATVSAIRPTASGIDIVTSAGEERYDRVVVCAGSWINELLNSLGITLPFTVTRQVYMNFHVNNERMFSPGAVPVWIDGGSMDYGFPVVTPGHGIKVSRHVAGIVTTPLDIDRVVHESDRQPLADYAMRRFAGLTGEIAGEGVCLYTNTPNEDFVIDHAPREPRIVIVSACSGHGFKFGPLTGELAARLASGQSNDISRFRIR